MYQASGCLLRLVERRDGVDGRSRGLAGLRAAIAKCVIGNAAAGHPIPDE
jgi:hypothetical protein